MEERILDEDESRGIRIKRTADGETDAVEGTEAEEEVAFEFPEEYDETLAGMSQSQVEEELARRAKAREEALAACKKLIAEGNALLSAENFADAEEKFAQATVYDADDEDAARGLFAAATKNFTDTERLYDEERAEDLKRLPAGRAAVLEKLGPKLEAERTAYRAEADALEPAVAQKREKLRAAFAANRRYYIVWTCVALFLAVAFCVAAAISADNILRVKDGSVPLALTITFGVLAFLALTATAVLCTRLVSANKLCKRNERADATQDGARLALLLGRLDVLDALLSDAPTEEE